MLSLKCQGIQDYPRCDFKWEILQNGYMIRQMLIPVWVFEDGDLEKGKFSRWLGWTLSPLPISRSRDACPSFKPKRKDFHIFQRVWHLFFWSRVGALALGWRQKGGNCFSWWVLAGCVGCMSISNRPDLCRENKGERGRWGVLSSYRWKMLSPTEQSEMGRWVGW